MNDLEKKELQKLQHEYFMAEQAYTSYLDAENIIISRLSREMTAQAGEVEFEFILEEKNKDLIEATKKLEAFKTSLK